MNIEDENGEATISLFFKEDIDDDTPDTDAYHLHIDRMDANEKQKGFGRSLIKFLDKNFGIEITFAPDNNDCVIFAEKIGAKEVRDDHEASGFDIGYGVYSI